VCVCVFLESLADSMVNNKPLYFGKVQWNCLCLHLLFTPVLQLLLVYFFIFVFCEYVFCFICNVYKLQVVLTLTVEGLK